MQGLSPVRFVGPSFTTTSLGPNDPKVGDLALIDNEVYRFVYNTGNSAIAPSKVVTLSGVSGYSVTVSTTTSVDLVVGVCKHATIATGAYGFVVINGFARVTLPANVSAAAGAILVPAADGAVVEKTTGVGYTSPAVIKLMDALATSASGVAYVSLY